MSKISDAQIRAKEIKEYYEWGYMEHLYELMPQQPKLTKQDIEEMEKSYSHSSIPSYSNTNASVPSSSLNNQYYEPNEENYYAN